MSQVLLNKFDIFSPKYFKQLYLKPEEFSDRFLKYCLTNIKPLFLDIKTKDLTLCFYCIT